MFNGKSLRARTDAQARTEIFAVEVESRQRKRRSRRTKLLGASVVGALVLAGVVAQLLTGA